MDEEEQIELSARQKRIIPYLLVHNKTEACRQARVGRKVLWEWEQQEHFQEAVRKARAKAFESALDRVKANIDLAVDILVGLAQSGEKEESRIRCAVALLERGIELKRIQDVEERLANLERMLR